MKRTKEDGESLGGVKQYLKSLTYSILIFSGGAWLSG